MSGSLSFETLDCLIRVNRIRNPSVEEYRENLPPVTALHGVWIELERTSLAPETPDIEARLYFGVHAYCLQLDDELNHPSTWAGGNRFFIEEFTRLGLPRTVPQRECMMWNHLCFAGGMKLYDTAQSDSFMDLLLVEYPECHDWEYLEAICRQFLWTKKMLRNWESYWTEAMLRMFTKQSSPDGEVYTGQ